MTKRIFLCLALIVFLCATVFKNSFTTFFLQDDFYHMALTQSQPILDSFNIFKPALMNYYVYRPLATQVFWNVGMSLFNLNTSGYHIIYFGFFAVDILLVYYLALNLTRNYKAAVLSAFFYALSPANYYRLYFLSTFQETLMALFVFSAVLLYLKKSWLALPFFLLALTCKETAVVTPLAFFLLDFYEKRKPNRFFWLSSVVAAVYFFVHKYYFGFFSGGAYVFDFNPLHVLNNYLWYGVWGLGFPESFMNLKLIVWPTIINLKFFTAFDLPGRNITIIFGVYLALLILALYRYLKSRENLKLIFTLFVFFGLYILPVGFFPFHKFASSLAVPLFGISVILALLLKKFKFSWLVLGVFAVLIVLTTRFNEDNHWTTKNARLAENVLMYFENNFKSLPKAPNIYFRDKTVQACLINQSGVNWSEQLSYALSDAKGLQIYYHEPSLQIFYEDMDKDQHLLSNSLLIYSYPFFKVN